MKKTTTASKPLIGPALGVIAGLALSAPGAAAAQTSAPSSARAPASTPAASTPDYTEHRVDGNQRITFPGDELPAAGPSYYGDTIRRPPTVLRAGLVRPRLNFVPELLKAVENL